MLLILYNPSLGRAVQRGAAAELARSHKWFGISDPNHAAVDDRSAPIRSAFVGVELYPTALGGAALLTSPSSRAATQKSVCRTHYFQKPSRTWQGISIAQGVPDREPAQVFEE
ncbi:hypothetical protein [Bradyrhizobium sp. CCBAU 45389]|uniref:hypothetical protein n=1 Tax=Bradyrhizobium sp. CCBAU 45389 TaxID=858429 RepID=UPI00230690E9|nr:hypothetical protein [Bradyrhizobium sp. CCBAU 45389]